MKGGKDVQGYEMREGYERREGCTRKERHINEAHESVLDQGPELLGHITKSMLYCTVEWSLFTISGATNPTLVSSSSASS